MNTKALVHNLPDIDAASPMLALRRTILDLAVRGKLVSQNPQDTPVSLPPNVLMHRSEKTLRPKWKLSTLDMVCDFNFGDRITKKQHAGDKYPVYGGGGESFRTDSYNRSNEYVISRFALSKKCVRYVSEKFWLMDSGCTFSIKKAHVKEINKHFVGIYLLSIQQDIYALSRGQAQKNLDVKKFKILPIPIPPLPEQKRIITKINALMALCDKLEPVLSPDAVPSLRRAILDMAIRGKLVSQNSKDEPAFKLLKQIKEEKVKLEKVGKVKPTKSLPPLTNSEKPFSIPAGWEWVRFGFTHKMIRGVSYNRQEFSKIPQEGFLPILRANNIGNAINHDSLLYVINERISSEKIMKVGDILLALASGSKHLVGKSAIITSDKKCSFGAFCGILRFHFFPLCHYAKHFMRSDLYRNVVLQDSRGSGINNVKKNDLESIPFPLPPLAEQKRIVAKVDALMALCDQLELALADSRNNRRRLLNSLLNTAA